MLRINEVFINEVEAIREAINNIQLEGCMTKYDYYTCLNTKDMRDIEKKFVKALCKRSSEFLSELLARKLADKSKEELIKEIRLLYKEGFYAFDDQLCNEGTYEVMSGYFADADVYEDIVKEFNTVFDKMLEDMRLTKEAAEKKRVAEKIAVLSRTIEGSKASIERMLQEKEQLEAQLK